MSFRNHGLANATTIRRLLILVLAGSLFFFLYQQHHFRGLTDPDAMDHAQLGRALAEGRGYRTRLMRPIVLGTLARRQPGKAIVGELPELIWPPLYPATLAVAFRTVKPDFTVQPHFRPFAPETRAILPLNWLFTLATAILLFLTATRFFDHRVAGLAPVVYLLSQTVLQRAVSGLPDPMATMLATAALATAMAGIRTDPDAEPLGEGGFLLIVVASAGLTALAVLTDYSLALFIPAPLAACAMISARRRVPAIGLFAAVLLAALSPWILRNLQACGQPFGLAHLQLLHDTAAFPGRSLERMLTWNPDALRIGALLRLRWLEGLGQAGWITRWCANGETLFPALALLALLTPGFHAGIRPLRGPILLCGGLMLAIDPLLQADSPGRLLFPLLPWIILIGCAGLIGLIDRSSTDWPLIRQTIVATALLLHAAPVIAGLLQPRTPLPYPPLYPPFVAAACALVEEDELMVADQPWATAWYGNQRTLWLPNTMNDFKTVNDYHQTVAALYLTTVTGGRPYVGDLRDGRHRDWLPLIEGRLPHGFPLTEGLRLPPERLDQIILIGPGRFGARPPAE